MGKTSPDRSEVASSPDGKSPVSEGDNQEENCLNHQLAELHSELREDLVRIAWAICRDWSLAEDATQETFALLRSKWAQVPHENRKGWLIRTAQLTAKNLTRKERRQSGGELVPGIAGREPEFTLEIEESRQQLAESMKTLPNEQLQVLQLRFEEQLSFGDIAEQLKIPLGTALSRLRLAIDKLRKQITDE